MLPGQGVHLGHLGAGDVQGIDTAIAAAAAMHVEHDLGGFLGRLMKYFDQDLNHEFHGGEVVVMQDDPVHFRFAYFGLFFYLQFGIGSKNKILITAHDSPQSLIEFYPIVALLSNPNTRFSVGATGSTNYPAILTDLIGLAPNGPVALNTDTAGYIEIYFRSEWATAGRPYIKNQFS